MSETVRDSGTEAAAGAAERGSGARRLPQDAGPLADAALLKAVLDAIPLPTFLVDFDARVLLVNAAGRTLVADGDVLELRRAGEALGCLHAPLESRECGDAAGCKRCVIRNSVRQAVFSGAVHRARGYLEIARDGKAEEKSFLVSASPLEHQERKLAVLMLEEIGAQS